MSEALVVGIVRQAIETAVIVTLPMLLAILIDQGVPGRTFFRSVYFLPAVLSSVIIGSGKALSSADASRKSGCAGRSRPTITPNAATGKVRGA